MWSVRPSTLRTAHRWPRCRAARPTLSALQEVPRSSARPNAPGRMSSLATAMSAVSESIRPVCSDGPHAAQQRIAEEEEGDDGQGAEQHPLQPQRTGNAEQREDADQQGADAEEEDEEPAGSGQLQEPEDEPEHRPMPPLHVHDALHQCPTGAIMDGITGPHKAPSAGAVRRARAASARPGRPALRLLFAALARRGASGPFRPVQRRAVCGCAASRRAGPATSRAPGRCRRGRPRAGPVRRCAAPPGPSPCAAPGRT